MEDSIDSPLLALATRTKAIKNKKRKGLFSFQQLTHSTNVEKLFSFWLRKALEKGKSKKFEQIFSFLPLDHIMLKLLL